MALTFKFNADGSAYRRGLDRMRQDTKQFSGNVKGMLGAIFAGGAFASLMRSTISFGSLMSDLAARTKMTTREFMVFRDAARDAGVGQETLERALRNVMLRSQKALESNNNYRKSLTALGIDFQWFAGLSTSEQFIEVAKASHVMSDELDTAKNVAALLGDRAGPMLTEVLHRLATEGFDKVAESAVVMGDETAKVLDKAEDRLQKFGDNLKIKAAGFLESISILAGSQSVGALEAQGEKADRKSRASAVGIMQSEGVNFSDEDAKSLSNAKTSIGELVTILEKYDKTTTDFWRASVKARKMEREDLEAIKQAEKEKRDAVAKELKLKEEAKKRGEEIVKAQDDLTKAQYDALDPQEKINQLLVERAKILKDIESRTGGEGSQDHLDNLKDSKRLLEIAKERKSHETVFENEQKKKQSEADKKQKELDSAKSRESKVNEKNLLDSMDSEGKLAYLKKKQKEMLDRAGSDSSLSELERIKLRTEAKELTPEINSLNDSINSKTDPKATVLSSSLASIGGGGGAAVINQDPALAEAKDQTQVLKDIRDRLPITSGTEPTTPEL